MDSKRRAAIRKNLLGWYDVEARDLPWRNTRDPYAILVSEIMLQQTRVETVLRYFGPFLKRFPNIESLSKASVDDVLKAWEGLGYYRRAHNLHRAAQAVMADHGGQLPRSAAELRKLPGIGPYTAGAVASIAFDLDEPVLDGNVIRVLSRLLHIEGDTSKTAAKHVLLDLATQLLPSDQASAFNQALMDLGARICLPRSPRCDDCPISRQCDAHHHGEETAFPQKPKRKQIPHMDVVAGVIWSDSPIADSSQILIAQRKADDMLGGLWEFPGGRVEEGETNEEALRRELKEELGIDVDVLEQLMDVRHAYTHFRMTLHVYHCRHVGGRPRAIDCADWTWVDLSHIRSYAFSTADRRVITRLEEECGAP